MNVSWVFQETSCRLKKELHEGYDNSAQMYSNATLSQGVQQFKTYIIPSEASENRSLRQTMGLLQRSCGWWGGKKEIVEFYVLRKLSQLEKGHMNIEVILFTIHHRENSQLNKLMACYQHKNIHNRVPCLPSLVCLGTNPAIIHKSQCLTTISRIYWVYCNGSREVRMPSLKNPNILVSLRKHVLPAYHTIRNHSRKKNTLWINIHRSIALLQWHNRQGLWWDTAWKLEILSMSFMDSL